MLSRNREGCLGVSFHQNCNKSCICWFKALRGRLIGPKTWDRIVGKFFGDFWIGCDSPEFYWAVCVAIMH